MGNAMTTDALTELRTGLAGCELVVLVDVVSQTVLLSSAAVEQGQEHLDDLCAQAGSLLGQAGESFCILAHATGARVFLRASASDAVALCMVFDPQARLDGVEQAACDALCANLGWASHD